MEVMTINMVFIELGWSYTDIEKEYIHKHLKTIQLSERDLKEILITNHKTKPLASRLVKTVKSKAVFYRKEGGCYACIAGYVPIYPDGVELNQAFWGGQRGLVSCTCIENREIEVYLSGLASQSEECTKEILFLYKFCLMRGIIEPLTEVHEFDPIQVWGCKNVPNTFKVNFNENRLIEEFINLIQAW